jgi:hypothetical protein
MVRRGDDQLDRHQYASVLFHVATLSNGHRRPDETCQTRDAVTFVNYLCCESTGLSRKEGNCRGRVSIATILDNIEVHAAFELNPVTLSTHCAVDAYLMLSFKRGGHL